MAASMDLVSKADAAAVMAIQMASVKVSFSCHVCGQVVGWSWASAYGLRRTVTRITTRP